MRREVQQLLESLDPHLERLGFKRKKRDQEWIRSLDKETREHFHLSIGLGLVTPSVAVEYLELRNLVSKELGDFSMSTTFAAFAPSISWSIDTEVKTYIEVFERQALKWLGQFGNRTAAIECLIAQESGVWYSARIRLLPLLLASKGRKSEAIEFMRRESSIAMKSDKRVPSYEHFVVALEKQLAA